jgi:outer membrane receptor protein involved in Fe transport
LFVPNYITNSSVLQTDPCAPDADTGVATATLAQCLRTGVTAAQYGDGGATNTIIPCPAGQCSVQQGGNPLVRPEKSDTYSIGLLFTPQFLEGFNASIDYYDIRQKEVISSIPATTTFNNCLLLGDPLYCSRVVRTPQGYLFGDTVAGRGYVITPLENLSTTKTSGVDIQASYSRPVGSGSVSAAMYGSYLERAKLRTDAASPEYNCAGLSGPTCQSVQPRWRHSVRLTWDTPVKVSASLQWRYIGQAKLELNSSQPVIGVPNYGDEINATLKEVNYFDLTGAWDMTEKVSWRAGVNNVFDKSPQIISGGDISGVGGPNAYPSYDLLGRTIFVGLTANF